MQIENNNPFINIYMLVCNSSPALQDIAFSLRSGQATAD
jgi:hypothetical protein